MIRRRLPGLIGISIVSYIRSFTAGSGGLPPNCTAHFAHDNTPVHCRRAEEHGGLLPPCRAFWTGGRGGEGGRVREVEGEGLGQGEGGEEEGRRAHCASVER
ncbi:hypothetical protein C8Q74DRAFT_139042 [Fomes fomentarius]|nr:hypothetical protein C8Q74DRAFT_139042 [Fomes fomentarius]